MASGEAKGWGEVTKDVAVVAALGVVAVGAVTLLI